MDEEKRYGFRVVISEEIFSDILAKAMGFEIGTFRVTQASTFAWNRAIEVCAVTNDERFPELKEGEMFPQINLMFKSVPIEKEDGSTRYEIQIDGFMEA